MLLNRPGNNFEKIINRKSLALTGAVCLLLLGALLVLYVYTITLAPRDFPLNVPIVIEPGLITADITQQLESQNVVRSSTALYITIILFHDPSEVKAGSYVFNEAQNVFSIARQITDDNPATENVTLTLIEGTTVTQYAKIAEQYLPEFNSEQFLTEAKPLEGFLFPDTYYVPYTFTENQLIELLQETYQKRVQPLIETNESTLTESEIITLASIVEREANTIESMRTVAGILLNRLLNDMPLQADATMEYEIDRPLSELTPEDLERDSPYNTYLYTGLPPTPIGNPGINSIMAVLEPLMTDYFYYITGNDGAFYYAETYEQHKQNIIDHLQ